MTDHILDVVIPLGINDIKFINKVIECANTNIIGLRNIYVVYSVEIDIENIKDISEITNVTLICENIFPFNIKYVKERSKKGDRSGWYLQQLIKLYSGFIIDKILNNYLVIDSDTFFLNKSRFFKDDKPMYAYSNETHAPYFVHMKRLHPSLRKVQRRSGICHHMLFQKDKVKGMMDLISNYHDNKKFFDIFFNNWGELLES